MSHIPFSNPAELGGCVYYSQNREDLILQSFFPDVKKGFYIDVGAFDPDDDSVTKLFYQQGWNGINVEPQPDRYKLFKKLRRRDINLNIGISTKNTTLTLRSYKSQGLSTFSDQVKHDYEAAPDQDTREFVEHTVEVHPLQQVLKEQNITDIHFMKVDVEGFEYEVLASNDWKKFRPQVLCVEANHVKQDWHPLLRQEGYELVFDDGLNEYFADSRTDRKQKFNFIKDVVNDRGGGLRADHFARMMQLYEFGLHKANHLEEVLAREVKLQRQLNKARQTIAEQEVALQSVKATAARLGALVKQRVTGKK